MQLILLVLNVVKELSKLLTEKLDTVGTEIISITRKSRICWILQFVLFAFVLNAQLPATLPFDLEKTSPFDVKDNPPFDTKKTSPYVVLNGSDIGIYELTEVSSNSNSNILLNSNSSDIL